MLACARADHADAAVHRLLETCAVLLCAVLALLAGGHALALAAADTRILLLLVPALLLALATADLLSGVVHYLLDCKGSPATPVFGVFIRPFRDHHVDPAEMTRRDFVHTNGHTAMAIAPLLALLLLARPQAPQLGPALGFVFLAALLLCLGLTNQLHKWVHAAHAPAPVRWLQAVRLVLPRHGHALHHAGHRDHFCITTGWNNGWLSRTQLLQRVFGR